MAYLWTSIKLQFRIPVSIFFSLLFPLIMMFAMMTSYGNFEIGNGYHFIDKYFLISTGMGLLPISLISFPICLGESIQNQTYKRLEYLGIGIPSMIISDIFAYILLAFLSLSINIIFGFVIYDLHIPSLVYLVAYVLQGLYCSVVFLILGALMALFVKNTRALLPIGMSLMFSCYIFTGAFSTFSKLPETFQMIGKYIPMKYVMNDFFHIWTEDKLVLPNLLTLNTVLGIGLTIIVVLFFVITRKRK
ncbi:hypothetical protein FACS1894193_08660 [Bacilli bacterium]|nr:hypothetical protein FACS1894192_00310 [Bacilli bacterium]GHU42769.1 hypothetical protein FACS1894193_08660 [Bacilli bacterium]